MRHANLRLRNGVDWTARRRSALGLLVLERLSEWLLRGLLRPCLRLARSVTDVKRVRQLGLREIKVEQRHLKG